MKLNEALQSIALIDEQAVKQAKDRWLSIAKPLFSLGKLENAMIQIAGIKGSSQFNLSKKGLVIMCADNGVVEEGISQSGQNITAIVAENFMKNETSVCHMANIAHVDILPVDIGIAVDIPSLTLKEKKVSYGTNNFVKGPAMTREQAIQGIEIGIQVVKELKDKGYDILATGEMGIGNTTTSSAITAVLLEKPVELVTGKGAGLSGEGLDRKINAIKKAIKLNQPDKKDPMDVLSKLGGLDIAGLVGVFIGGAVYRIPIVIDGFISSVSALLAERIAPACKPFMLPSHVSAEPACQMLLDELKLKPFLTCDMCLGEGSGAVALFPLLDMGLEVYSKMSTFQDISIDNYEILK